MDETDAEAFDQEDKAVLALASDRNVRLTLHAQQEMLDEGVGMDDVLEAVAAGRIIENYPDHKRGACCLVYGLTRTGRPLHVVCTTA